MNKLCLCALAVGSMTGASLVLNGSAATEVKPTDYSSEGYACTSESHFIFSVNFD